MKSLTTIIKLHKNELDELRKALVKFEEEKEQLRYYNKKLEEDLAKEQEIVGDDLELKSMLLKYRKKIKERQATIAVSIRDLNNMMNRVKEDIGRKFAEIKKFEILLANKKTQLQKQELDKEIRELDEIALNAKINELLQG